MGRRLAKKQQDAMQDGIGPVAPSASRDGKPLVVPPQPARAGLRFFSLRLLYDRIMRTCSKNTALLAKNEQIARLVCERSNLEFHATELKTELTQMKRALRVTQERIRSVNMRLEKVRRGKPFLRLVVSRDRAADPSLPETDPTRPSASRIDDNGN